MGPLPMTGCPDCDRSTWRCWRHSVRITPAPVVYIYPVIVFRPITLETAK